MRGYLSLLQLYLYSKTGQDFFLPKKIYPLRSSLRLTEHCNSRCLICNYWKKKWEDKISTDKAVDIIKQLNKVGVKRLRFTGGEPLLRGDFFKILSFVKDLGFKKITVATNGLLLDKYAKDINESCITDLGVSLDGLGENNDRIRGIKGGFEKVIRSLKKIRGKRITIMTTLHSDLSKDLPGLFKVVEGNGWLWDINLPDNHLYFLKDVDLEDFWPSEKEVDKILNIIGKNRNRPFLKRLSDLQLNHTRKYLKREKIEELPCFLGYTDIDIDSAGNLYSGCYVLPAIGNVLENDLETILNSPLYKKRLDIMVKRNCPGCSCGYEFNLIIKYLISKSFQRICRKGIK